MKIIQIHKNGKTEENEFSREDLTRRFNIHLRDLRPVFLRKYFSNIMPRGRCIIISVRSVKIIIEESSVFIFNKGNPRIEKYFIPLLQEKIQTQKETPEEIRFEHLVLETALQYIFQKFQRRYEDIERTSEQMLDRLSQQKVEDSTLEKLLHLKKRLSNITTQIEDIEDEITEIIDDEDDLKKLYLNQKTPPKNINQLESILEDVLDQIEDMGHSARELEENIDDTQEILTLKMNNIRNMVIKFDLLLTGITCFLAVLAVVTGFFGMNIKNNMEGDSNALWYIGIGLFVFFILGFGSLTLWMKKKKMV